MRIKKLQLKEFKRFDDLTIDLGENPKKIIALVGPNGCGKSSIFDAFEEKLKDMRQWGTEDRSFFSKAFHYSDFSKRNQNYNRQNNIIIEPKNINRKSFYIRTAYRFTSKIQVSKIETMPSLLDVPDEPISSIALDTRLESNYKRLQGASYEEFFKGDKTGATVRDELISNINHILNKILEIEISSLGNVLNGQGQLFFKKGDVTDFPYSNLSSGEKEVVDIIIDLIVKTKEFNETVFCIDEPELHINTSIQRKLLVEINNLIPHGCQLWVATHSIGFLRALQEELKDDSAILDFTSGDYFSGSKRMTPMIPTRKNWMRIFKTALEDLTGLISPKKIIFCEGKDKPGKNGTEQGLDAQIYEIIFSEKYNDVVFVSSGGNTELDQRASIALTILTKVFNELEILILKDRDFLSDRKTTLEDRSEYLKDKGPNYKVLERFEIENYLYDKEVLSKYCANKDLVFNNVEYDKLVTNIFDQEVKELTPQIKNFCGISYNISNEKFKFELAKTITPEMLIYNELERCIF